MIHSNAPYAAVGGGHANQITPGVGYATIGGGRSNNIAATSQHATIPGGLQANAANFGQMAYASGAFANVGDAQSSLFVLRNTTTNATPTELFLDGRTAHILLPSGRTMTFEILVAARSTVGNSAGYQIRGVIEFLDGGGVAFVGTPLKTVLGEDVLGWDVNVEAASLALKINATGAAGETVRWVASVRTAEVDMD